MIFAGLKLPLWKLRIDKKGLGQISFGEFEEFFKDEAVKAFFESLQIGAMDAWTLFVSLASWTEKWIKMTQHIAQVS